MELPRPFSKETRKYITFIPLIISTVMFLILVLILFTISPTMGLTEAVLWFFLMYIPAITIYDYINEPSALTS